MEPFNRKVRIGTLDTGYKTPANVTVDIQWTGERLSISGTAERPRAADIDQGGQMQDTIRAMPADGLLILGSERDRLVKLWDRWHLNDVRAECEHQRELGWTYATHAGEDCPVCGYRIGSAWLTEEVPADVLAYLRTFPPNGVA